MAKRKAKKKVPRKTYAKNAADRLRKALAKQTKPVLLDLLVGFATSDKSIMQGLEGRFDIETPTADLVSSTCRQCNGSMALKCGIDESFLVRYSANNTGRGCPRPDHECHQSVAYSRLAAR